MQAIAAAVEASDIDMTIMVPPTEVPRLGEVDALAVYQQPSVGPETLWFNLEHEILSDPLVRQAIAHAIDTEAFTEGVLQGTTTPANSIFSNASWAYDPTDTFIEYDPDRAKELLAEAGYADGFTVELSTNQGNFFRELFVEFAQAELAKVALKLSSTRQNGEPLSAVLWKATMICVSTTKTPVFLIPIRSSKSTQPMAQTTGTAIATLR